MAASFLNSCWHEVHASASCVTPSAVVCLIWCQSLDVRGSPSVRYALSWQRSHVYLVMFVVFA